MSLQSKLYIEELRDLSLPVGDETREGIAWIEAMDEYCLLRARERAQDAPCVWARLRPATAAPPTPMLITRIKAAYARADVITRDIPGGLLLSWRLGDRGPHRDELGVVGNCDYYPHYRGKLKKGDKKCDVETTHHGHFAPDSYHCAKHTCGCGRDNKMKNGYKICASCRDEKRAAAASAKRAAEWELDRGDEKRTRTA